jgi:hypothetical protein
MTLRGVAAMRISALRYMFARGVLGGAAVFGLVMLVARIGGWNTGLIDNIVSGGAFNQPASTALVYFSSIFVSVLAGGVAGGLMGLASGLYTDRYVKRHFARIFDVNDYATRLGWRTGLFTASLAVAAVFIFMLPIFSTLPGVALIVLAGLTGGMVGRGFAFEDMANRREKKQHSINEIAYADSLQRLETRDASNSAFRHYDERMAEQRVV